MGRECFEALSEHECQQIYDNHQRDLIENAKHNFQVNINQWCYSFCLLELNILLNNLNIATTNKNITMQLHKPYF